MKLKRNAYNGLSSVLGAKSQTSTQNNYFSTAFFSGRGRSSISEPIEYVYVHFVFMCAMHRKCDKSDCHIASYMSNIHFSMRFSLTWLLIKNWVSLFIRSSLRLLLPPLIETHCFFTSFTSCGNSSDCYLVFSASFLWFSGDRLN